MNDSPSLAGRIRSFAGLFVSREGIRLACGMMLASAVIFLVVLLATARGGRTAIGSTVGNDFAGFYLAATILNEYPPDRLYDLKLQGKLLHERVPGIPPDKSLIYAHAPFLAVWLRPWGRLPFVWSYAAWLAVAAGLALAGLALTLRTTEAIPPGDRATALLLALTFEPLLMESWLGGQMAVLGMFWVAVALRCARRDRPFGMGAALAMMLYKPTLMVLVVPMLVVAARPRALAGFVAAAAGLAGFTWLAVGWEGGLSYVRLLLNYARFTSGGAPGFQVNKHIDLNSFFTLLLGGPTPAARVAMLATALAALPFLAACWWRARRHGDDRLVLALCATFSGTAVFNLYTPIYDVALVLPGVVLTADVLYRRAADPGRPLGPGFRALVALLVVVPWVSQRIAREVGFQPLTLVLLALGSYQIALAHRIGQDGTRQIPRQEKAKSLPTG